MKASAVILTLLTCALFCAANEAGFKRYQIIIDKYPFGDEPPASDMIQIASSQSFAGKLRLTMIYEGPNGDLRAGIIDESKKKNYILGVGETINNLTLVSANLSDSEVEIRMGNELARLGMKKSGVDQPTNKGRSERPKSYAERLRARHAAMKKDPPAETPTRLTGEALKKQLQNVQMDAIRNNLPPLPMPLTPEMDAQLVAEGVLDPQ